MYIAIIGAGQVGSNLARAWAKHGHSLLLGTRDPQSEKMQALLTELAQMGSPHVEAADVVTVAQKDVPLPLACSAVEQLGSVATPKAAVFGPLHHHRCAVLDVIRLRSQRVW